MADILEDFIVNYEFGHYIWTQIQNAPYVDWMDDDSLDYAVGSSSSERYKRIPAGNYRSPADWTTTGLNLSTNLEYANDLALNSPRFQQLGGACTTELGTRFWFEYEQRILDERPDDLVPGEPTPIGPAVADPIRIPAPESFREDIREWAQSYPGGEITRVKGAIFEERFADAGVEGPDSYVGKTHRDFHVKIPDIEDRETLRSVFDESVEMVQRVVRAER